MLVGDLDAVNAQLDDYGIIDKEKVEEIKSQQAAVEQKIERVAAEENTDTEDYDNSEGLKATQLLKMIMVVMLFVLSVVKRYGYN